VYVKADELAQESVEKPRLGSGRDIFLPLLEAVGTGVALIFCCSSCSGFDDVRYNRL
jgi:hypothetical protein